MTKPTRKKKYNKTKSLQMAQRVIVRNKAMVFVAGIHEKGAELLSFRTMESQPATLVELEILRNNQFRWAYHIAVACRDQLGQNYIQSRLILCLEPYYADEMEEYLNEVHQKLVQESNPNHRITAAWIASPEACAVSDEELYNYLETKGVFCEYRTPYEETLIQKEIQNET